MPRSSVTPTNVLPVASFEAVTVTPGRTAPVESVTVPVSTASCANAATGSRRMTPIASTRLAKPQVMESPSSKVPTRIVLCGAHEISVGCGPKSRKTLTLAPQRGHGFKIVLRVKICRIALHGSAQMLHRFLERAALGERRAEVPVRLRGVGIEGERLAEFGDGGVELAARGMRDPEVVVDAGLLGDDGAEVGAAHHAAAGVGRGADPCSLLG